MGNSFFPTFFNASFHFVTLKSKTWWSHTDFLSSSQSGMKIVVQLLESVGR